ncbi:MAG: hypothetical protein HKO57_00985 [Akkermansiaceae bacterium]|nr:hypothetical protein [Akkermansiaceae bacterium]
MKSKLLPFGGLPVIAAVLALFLPAASPAEDGPNMFIQERFELERIPIPEPPDPAPCPVLRAGDIRQQKPHHDVKLYFPWALGVDESTIGDGDIVASGPDGYRQGGTFVSLERLPVPFPLPLSTVPEGTNDVFPVPQPHPILVATYRFFPPPGTGTDPANWTNDDNGTYTVRLAPGEIANDEGRFLPAKFLGAFRCAIRTDPGTPVQPVDVRIDIRRVPAPSLAPDNTAPTPVPHYQAVVRMFFDTPHVEVDWGTVTRTNNRFVAGITALKLPLPDPDPWPVPLPLAGEPAPAESGGEAPANYPVIRPVFTHIYDLGPLGAGTYAFIARVNGINEGAKSFTIPPDPPVDDDPPAAELSVRNITRPFNGPQRLAVVYKDRSGVDVRTLGDGDIVVLNPCLFIDAVTPIPCSWQAQRARLVEVIPLSDNRTKVKAIYEIDPPDGGWTAAHNGFYPVVQPADAVCDRLGNCNPRRRLGGFEVAIDPDDPPIPAKAEIRVDASNPDRVQAKVHVKFDGYFRIVSQDIRRVGNRILLLATAEPVAVPAIFPPPPFPEEDLLYEIGPLRPGEYLAAFLMNRHLYDTEPFRVRRQPPIPADVQLTIDPSDPSNVTATVVIQFETPHRVEPGNVERDGERIVLPAKARPLPILSTDPSNAPPPRPAPVTLTYQVGALPSGGYLGVFVMNDFPYAAEHFIIDRCHPPIAEAGIRIDQDDPANTKAVVKIAFFTPHAIVGRDIHRRGNFFLLEAKAVPVHTLGPAAEFAPVPVPQIVTIEYPLGDLDPGQYGAKFVLNGCPLADATWVERGDTFEADVSIVTSETSSGNWNAEVTILFRNPHVRITDPGEVVIDGHIIKIDATAELPSILPQNAPPPSPIVLNYDLGALAPGGWWLKYFINGNFEKQHDFFVRPDPPIPADVELRVDVSSQPVIAHKRIQFRDHYRIVDQSVERIGNVFFLDAEADGPLPILAPLPPPPIDLDYDLGVLPRGFYLAACRINGFVYDVQPFWVPDQGFEAEVDLRVDVGDTVKLTAVVDIDDPYVIVTDWGTPVISASGEIKIDATAERVVFIQEPSGDPMENCYDLGALPPGIYHVTFCLNGEPEARLRFRVPERCDPLPHVTNINIAQGNVSWFSEVVIALLPGQVLTDCGVVRRSNNEFHVNITVECLQFPEPPVPLPAPGDPNLPEGIVFDIEEIPHISGVPIRLVKCEYVLGPLDQGHYKFFVHSRGQTVACQRFEVPGMPPSVNLLAGNITAPTNRQPFGLEFQDPTGLNHECIMNAPVWVVGPNGYRELATQNTYTSTDDDPSTYANARYEISGPGGDFDHTDNGRYCVYVNPGDIKDLDGNHIESGRLGCFQVRIAPPPTPGVNVSVAMNSQGEWEATVEIISEPGAQVVIDDWDAVALNFGVVFLRLADARIESTGGPVEPLAHVYNLGTLTPGSYIFVFKTDIGHCGSATFEVPGLEGDPLDAWRFRNGFGDASEGEALKSYFFATTPDRADAANVTPLIVTDDDGSRHFGIEYRGLVGADGVISTVEASDNVGAWVDAADLVEIRERTVDADGTERVIICLRDPVGVSRHEFLRIRLERDQP